MFDSQAGQGHGAKVPVVQGYFNVILGTEDVSGRSIVDAFSSADAYLQISVDGDAPILPRQQVLSAPYAIVSNKTIEAEHAKEADHALEANHAARATEADNALKIDSGTKFFNIKITGDQVRDAYNKDKSISLGNGITAIIRSNYNSRGSMYLTVKELNIYFDFSADFSSIPNVLPVISVGTIEKGIKEITEKGFSLSLYNFDINKGSSFFTSEYYLPIFDMSWIAYGK